MQAGHIGLSLTAPWRTAGGGGGPVAQNLNFGAKTRHGYGGYPTTETPNSALTGTYGGFFKIDDVGHLVPATAGAGTYGTSTWVPPVTVGNTVMVTGGSGKKYNITIINGMHAREKTVAPTNQDFGAVSFGQPDNQLAGYLGDQANGVVAGGLGTTKTLLGDTIWCRDGHFNPSSVQRGGRFPRTSQFGAGSGSTINIRSETVDSSVDASGRPIRKHGFQMGCWRHSDWDDTIVGTSPIRYVDIWFYNINKAAGEIPLLGFNRGFPVLGVVPSNCRFSQPESWTNAEIAAACSGITAIRAPYAVNDNTFYGLNGGIVTDGNPGAGVGYQGHTVKRNYMNRIRDTDCVQIGFNGWDLDITDNAFVDFYSETGTHTDAIQYLGLQDGSTTKNFGTIARNKCWSGINPNESLPLNPRRSQGIVVFDRANGSRFATGLIEHCVLVGGDLRGISVEFCDDIVIRWCFTIACPSVVAGRGILVGGGNNASITRSVTENITTSDGSATTGTVVTTPNYIVGGHSVATVQAAGFPNYQDIDAVTNYSDANFIALVTPTTAAYNGALNKSGAYDDTGALNAA